jgi:hypothetical protein
MEVLDTIDEGNLYKFKFRVHRLAYVNPPPETLAKVIEINIDNQQIKVDINGRIATWNIIDIERATPA